MKQLSLIVLCFVALHVHAQLNLRFEEGVSPDHATCIAAYEALVKKYQKTQLKEMGPSDSGRPIHLFIAGDMAEHKPTILINNGIHAGESCGVDASLLLIEELLRADSPILDRVNIAIIPMYNIGGALNRSCCTRANQKGPLEQGFRGNAKNLDLNRDFMKADSRNALTFHKIFAFLEPEFLVDTHTSNGADYQYTMTLIHSQLDMIAPHLANTYRYSLIPDLYTAMESSYPMVPYVDLVGKTPEEGIIDFPDFPRYSTGYASLYNCFGFTSEAHMLKPYRDRVMATYHFLKALAQWTSDHDREVVMNKQKADRELRKQGTFYMNHELDSAQVDSVFFKGFRAEFFTSDVTGLERLRYDQSTPWEGYIPHFKNYKNVDPVIAPKAYYISQAWGEVIELLEANGVKMTPLKNDTIMKLRVYRIASLNTSKQAFEGHYLHDGVTTTEALEEVRFYKGDFMILLDQRTKNYLIEALEPRAVDSFFAWGFFDIVLQQKEWFSPYVFEDMALDMLKADSKLNKEFREKQKSDKDFAASEWAQLIYLYQRSPYYEKEHMRYPVFRSLD